MKIDNEQSCVEEYSSKRFYSDWSDQHIEEMFNRQMQYFVDEKKESWVVKLLVAAVTLWDVRAIIRGEK